MKKLAILLLAVSALGLTSWAEISAGSIDPRPEIISLNKTMKSVNGSVRSASTMTVVLADEVMGMNSVISELSKNTEQSSYKMYWLTVAIAFLTGIMVLDVFARGFSWVARRFIKKADDKKDLLRIKKSNLHYNSRPYCQKNLTAVAIPPPPPTKKIPPEY